MKYSKMSESEARMRKARRNRAYYLLHQTAIKEATRNRYRSKKTSARAVVERSRPRLAEKSTNEVKV